MSEHFTDDFDITFQFAPFNHKYFVTDKRELFSITPFFRNFTNNERTDLNNASHKLYTARGDFNLDKIKSSNDSLSRFLQNRIDELEEQYNDTKERINHDRLIYIVTKLSIKKKTVQFYFDGISKHDFDTMKQNTGIKYEPKNKDYYETRGYQIKRVLKTRQKQIYNPNTRKIETETFEYYTYYFLINREALISSILEKELCDKGMTWKDGKQVKIDLGRKGKKISILDEKGVRHDFDTIKDFAKFFSSENCVRGLRKAMKKCDGITLTFKGKTVWFINEE